MEKLTDFAFGVLWFIGFMIVATPVAFALVKGLIWLGIL